MTSNIDYLIRTFLASQENNVQIDVFRENGQVLLQIYKMTDVNRWQMGVEFPYEKGVVFELNFHPSKTDNSNNRNRFSGHELNSRFKTFDAVKRNAYFTHILDTDVKSIHELLSMIIKEVYCLDEYKLVVNHY